MQKFPMTLPGLQRLEEELRTLKSVERPAVILAIAEARSHGDLSENAEYHAAKERQGKEMPVVANYILQILTKLMVIVTMTAVRKVLVRVVEVQVDREEMPFLIN